MRKNIINAISRSGGNLPVTCDHWKTPSPDEGDGVFCREPVSVVIYAFMAGRDWVSHVVFVVLTIQNHSM
ncbi:hypothetical protein HMPREF9374_3725 [Desmospora sp. 8437]|nr:hypothetical protein HMPREF9374_3725 [Desmospora sp. 8437]